ncbi:MAG: fatty acid cis/trans isomerase, partial [Campylobacterota bacterium]|nr:fatty acid cis/trans isomerase [Campylobacterota bacterium]
IHDHFWVMFMDPKHDLTVQHPEFIIAQEKNLRLPTEQGSGGRVRSAFSDAYRDRYARFYDAKMAMYEKEYPDGLGMETIWPGGRADDAPLLTVYRHFDSASVHKGVLGDLPRTLWTIDYSQFERIYYALVAGFDVFGNVTHQTNVRRYMDYLRIEGELNFLHFLPNEVRLPMIQSWYIGDSVFDNVKYEDTGGVIGTKIDYRTDDPKRELVERIVNDHIRKETDITFDLVNYHAADEKPPVLPQTYRTEMDYINGFRALTAPGTGFIRHINSYNINVLYMRIRNVEGRDRFVSIVINRWHDNVNALFNEKKRLDSSKDTIDFFPYSIGSYPNYFVDIDFSELPEFFDLMANFERTEYYMNLIRKFGINRADPKFWDGFKWFQDHFNQRDPLNAGLYDLNRYYYKAW